MNFFEYCTPNTIQIRDDLAREYTHHIIQWIPKAYRPKDCIWETMDPETLAHKVARSFAAQRQDFETQLQAAEQKVEAWLAIRKDWDEKDTKKEAEIAQLKEIILDLQHQLEEKK